MTSRQWNQPCPWNKNSRGDRGSLFKRGAKVTGPSQHHRASHYNHKKTNCWVSFRVVLQKAQRYDYIIFLQQTPGIVNQGLCCHDQYHHKNKRASLVSLQLCPHIMLLYSSPFSLSLFIKTTTWNQKHESSTLWCTQHYDDKVCYFDISRCHHNSSHGFQRWYHDHQARLCHVPGWWVILLFAALEKMKNIRYFCLTCSLSTNALVIQNPRPGSAAALHESFQYPTKIQPWTWIYEEILIVSCFEIDSNKFKICEPLPSKFKIRNRLGNGQPWEPLRLEANNKAKRKVLP